MIILYISLQQIVCLCQTIWIIIGCILSIKIKIDFDLIHFITFTLSIQKWTTDMALGVDAIASETLRYVVEIVMENDCHEWISQKVSKLQVEGLKKNLPLLASPSRIGSSLSKCQDTTKFWNIYIFWLSNIWVHPCRI